MKVVPPSTDLKEWFPIAPIIAAVITATATIIVAFIAQKRKREKEKTKGQEIVQKGSLQEIRLKRERKPDGTEILTLIAKYTPLYLALLGGLASLVIGLRYIGSEKPPVHTVIDPSSQMTTSRQMTTSMIEPTTDMGSSRPTTPYISSEHSHPTTQAEGESPIVATPPVRGIFGAIAVAVVSVLVGTLVGIKLHRRDERSFE